MQHILLVEDDAIFADLVQDLLRYRLPMPYDLTAVPNIASALRAQRDYPAALILLDLGLPDTIGLSGVQQMLAGFPDTPILVVTADTDRRTADAVRALSPHLHFLVKDKVTIETFPEIVRLLLEHAAILRSRPAHELPQAAPLLSQAQEPLSLFDWGYRVRDILIIAIFLLGLYALYALVRGFLDHLSSEHAHVIELLKQILQHLQKGRAMDM